MLQSLLDSLRIDPLVLLLNGGLFLATLAILNFVFWKPMMRHLDRRKERIADAYRTVDDTRRELETLRQEYQTHLAQIEAQARAQIQSTVREAQRQRERVIADARAQGEETVRLGAQAIAQEKAQTAAAMHPALDDAALRALARVTGSEPTAEQRRLVDEYIEQNVVRAS